MFVVVSYDITDDRRRVRVASEMENFGQRVQLSVFECHLLARDLARLKKRLRELIDRKHDRVRYYSLCAKDRAQIGIDGPGEVSRDWDYHIV
jgi:CRISPR-associated protein Cas2